MYRIAAGQAAAELKLLFTGRGLGKGAQKDWVLKGKLNENIYLTFFPFEPEANSTWAKYRGNSHWTNIAKSMVAGQDPLARENKTLAESIVAYNLDDAVYLEQTGLVLDERYKNEKDLTDEEQQDWAAAVEKYKRFGQDLRLDIKDIFFKDREKEFNDMVARFPSVAGQVYTERQKEVAKQGNWQLSVASTIPCVIGWSCMAQWLYSNYGMGKIDVSNTIGFKLYFKPNLSTAKPVDDTTYLDINGIECEKATRRPVLSESARKMSAWLQAGIENRTIDYPMWQALERQSRTFMHNEINLANNAEKPSDEDLNVGDEQVFKDLLLAKGPTDGLKK